MTTTREAVSPAVGTIAWRDLTVPNAESIRTFYEQVVGWKSSPVDLGSYSDFEMLQPSSGESVAGICHARGSNAGLPPVWLIYITVEDLDHSLQECQRLGGALVAAPRSYGGGRYCVIQDPAGALCALYQPPDAA